MMKNKQAIPIWILIAALLVALPVHIFTRPSDGGMKIITTGGSGGGTWGSIAGTVSDQTDLQSALDSKLDKTGGTVTGNLNITGVVSGNGSGLTGVIADGMNGTVFVGTDSFRFVPGPGKDVVFEFSGTGSAKIDNGTTTFTLKNPVQYYYYPNGVYATTTASATEVPFFSIVVAPKVMGANGQMEIYCLRNHGTTSATTPFRIAIYDGVGTQTLFYLPNISNTNYSQTYLLENCGSTSLQYSYGSMSAAHGASANSGASPGTYTVNTNNTCTVTFSGAGTASVTLYKTIIKTIYLD